MAILDIIVRICRVVITRGYEVVSGLIPPMVGRGGGESLIRVYIKSQEKFNKNYPINYQGTHKPQIK